MGSWPSRTEERLLFGLPPSQSNRLVSSQIHIHMRLPPVDVTRDAVLHTIAARQTLRGGIAPHLSIVASDASNSRALALPFNGRVVHIWPAESPNGLNQYGVTKVGFRPESVVQFEDDRAATRLLDRSEVLVSSHPHDCLSGTHRLGCGEERGESCSQALAIASFCRSITRRPANCLGFGWSHDSRPSSMVVTGSLKYKHTAAVDGLLIVRKSDSGSSHASSSDS